MPPSEKAAFHTVTGTGKAHIKREFFGLNDRDYDAILERVGTHLDRAVKD